jgi:ElaB/YqjD/DUF883 family membrane-anchored ribosome-binding protein
MREVLLRAQELLDSMRREAASKYGASVARVRSNVQHAGDRIGDYGRSGSHRLRRAARLADDTVHEHPWTSTGTAFVLGAVAGAVVALLLMRR